MGTGTDREPTEISRAIVVAEQPYWNDGRTHAGAKTRRERTDSPERVNLRVRNEVDNLVLSG